MRIAYLGSKGLPSKSGTERVVEAIVSRLYYKHEITVYCDSRYTPKNTKIEGIRLIRIFTIKGKYIQPTSLFLMSAIHALFSKYDFIHLHSVEACFILPILRLKYRVVSTSHGIPSLHARLKWGKVARFLMRLMEYPYAYLSTCSTSVSSLDTDFIRMRYKRNNIYIPNGVDHNIQFNIKEAEDKLLQLGLEPCNYLMFAAGRIDPTKGCHILLDAVNNSGNPFKLAIVGDLNQVPEYSKHLKKIADKRHVVFIPPISNRGLLFGMVKLARLFIFPSITEGMSMMLLEAASLKTPIICSDIPENKIFPSGKVLYFRSEDTHDLANKIEWAVNHPDEMALLGQNASNYVIENLSWKKIIELYEDVYNSCMRTT